jgi:hypothetical protein
VPTDSNLARHVTANGNFAAIDAIDAEVSTRSAAGGDDFDAWDESKVHEVLGNVRGHAEMVNEGGFAYGEVGESESGVTVHIHEIENDFQNQSILARGERTATTKVTLECDDRTVEPRAGIQAEWLHSCKVMIRADKVIGGKPGRLGWASYRMLLVRPEDTGIGVSWRRNVFILGCNARVSTAPKEV